MTAGFVTQLAFVYVEQTGRLHERHELGEAIAAGIKVGLPHHPTDAPERRPRPHLRGTVAYLLEQRHADYALSAKGNQAAPLAWVHAALPPAVLEAEEHVQTERSHGRIIRRRSGPPRYLIN